MVDACRVCRLWGPVDEGGECWRCTGFSFDVGAARGVALASGILVAGLVWVGLLVMAYFVEIGFSQFVVATGAIGVVGFIQAVERYDELYQRARAQWEAQP